MAADGVNHGSLTAQSLPELIEFGFLNVQYDFYFVQHGNASTAWRLIRSHKHTFGYFIA